MSYHTAITQATTAYTLPSNKPFHHSPTLPHPFSSDTSHLTAAMALKLFSTIVNAIKSGEPELLEFADLTPEESTLVLESLFDPINHFEEYTFRVYFSAPDRHLRVVMPSSDPKRPVRPMVRPAGRQSGQSGHDSEQPGSVRLKLFPATKAWRRPGDRQAEWFGNPSRSCQMPRLNRQMPRLSFSHTTYF
ncbi:hypothetical protein L873DRAFT_1039340 [Choiromyces venosus 120613-1]|uniref:Uncharacterized protein n=1 Tax=Choiromyces venosus 120613-1 TaxID=1336337 RepID=A0A3N4JM35_9PEZI|nr:hypothetical protein L873DRAFT_1039340 [Choiromyces venosus 120613-1]